MSGAAINGVANGIVAPVLMSAAALAGDYVMRVDLPKFNMPELPKIDLPKLELPKIDLPFGKKGGAEAPIFIDENPNVTAKGAVTAASAPTGAVKVRASVAPKKVVDKQAPTLAELQRSRGQTIIASDDEWKAFPVRRLPGSCAVAPVNSCIHF